LELLKALAATVGSERVRHDCAKHHTDNCKQERPAYEKGRESKGERADRTQPQNIAGAYPHIRLGEQCLQIRDPLGTAKQVVERRESAQHLVSNQREFLARLAHRRLLYCFQTVAQQASLGTALIERPAEHKDQQHNQEENRDGNQDWHMFTSYSAISLA